MLASHLVPGPLAETLPDLVVLSKGLTGGFLPLSAVLATDEIYRRFDADHFERKAFLHSNTYTGNALGVAVALAALDVYADEDVLAQVAHGGQLLREQMAALVRQRPFLRNLRSAGMVAAVDLDGPGRPRARPAPAHRLPGLRPGPAARRPAAAAGRHAVPVSAAHHAGLGPAGDGRHPGGQRRRRFR